MSETQSPAPSSADEMLEVRKVLEGVGYDGFVRALFNRSGDPAKDFAHAALGIVTECHELIHAKDRVNFLEELGDLLFYNEALTQVTFDHLGYTTPEARGEAEDSMTRLEASEVEGLERAAWNEETLREGLNDLLDHAKRWVGYGKEPEDILKVVSHALTMSGVCLMLSYTSRLKVGELPEENITLKAVEANILKLLDRYKGMAFNADHAINRDVQHERETLEAAASRLG
jgi:NTP pyrophosphatase (non-canonical NTP hydrolase)